MKESSVKQCKEKYVQSAKSQSREHLLPFFRLVKQSLNDGRFFHIGIKGQGQSGVDLSAAAGIARVQSGYIQDGSKVGKGNMLKIYLPVV
jgi:hypothetical protein